MAKIESPFTTNFKIIRKQFIAKEKLIKSSLIVQKKSSDDKRRNNERESRINYENTLEKALGFLGRPIKKLGKKLGFLDSLKQFITNVLLGFIAVRLLKYLPQLMKVFTLILRVGDFILDISGKLLNGLITFVDKGYQAADHARKMVKNIGGQKAIDALDAMNNQANSLLNSIIIAGMLFSDFGGVGLGGVASKKAVDVGTEVIQEQVKRQVAEKAAQEVAKQGVRTAIGPLGAAGIVLGVGLLSSAVGEGAFQIKKFGKQLQSWTTGKLAEASQDKNPVTRFLKKGFFGWLSTTLGPAIWLLNGTGVLFDIVGAPFRYGVELIRAAVMKLNDDRKGLEQQNKNLGKFDARVRDGIREHFSILAPLFSFIGMKGVSQKLQTPGSFGSLYGEKAAKDMGYYRGGLVIKKFAGGGYTRSVGDEDEVKIPRTFKKDLSDISPGSAVGGSGMIQKVFPYSDENGVMNQYGYVDSSYQSLAGANYVGPLLGLTIKSIFGDKVTDADYDIVSGTLSSFLLSGAQEENPQAANQIYSSLGTDGLKPFIKGEILSSLRNTFGLIENQLRNQLGLKLPEIVKGKNDMECECPDESGGGGGEVVAGEIPPEGKALLDAIAGAEARGYNIRYGGQTFDSYKDHPRIGRRTPDGRSSDAAGRYQFLSTTWDPLAKQLGLKDFSPANQDRAAWQLAVNAYGYGVNSIIKDLRTDPMKVAYKLNGTWPSLPGGSQPNNATKGFLGRYNANVAKYKGQGSPSTAKIAPGSPAANVSDCVCDPETPTGDPGDVQAAGATTGGNISGYPVTSGYGMRKHPITGAMKMHGGIDIAGMRSGSPYALNVPGVAGPPPQYEDGYGNFIDIQIPSLGNLYFRFAHMAKPPNYKPGQKIPAGKIFGYAGTTGASTGVHLHFEVNKTLSAYGGDRDPMPYGKYISIGREMGGPTLSGGVRLLHKGEYVIDKDSVDLFGGIPFFTLINNVENENQRAQKSSQLIQHLSKYTGRKIDQRPEVIFEEPEDTVIMSPPIYVSTLSSFGGGGEESPNWEQDMCYARG
jgi:muramidase (phage lysozyme)